MTAIDDFFKKKMEEQNIADSSGGSAIDDFFKKKIAEQSQTQEDTKIITPPETKVSEDVSVNRPTKLFSDPTSIFNVTDSFLGKISPEQQKMNDMISQAKEKGLPFIQKLDPVEKDSLITGLKLRSLPVAEIPEQDRKLVTEFDNTPKENRTALKLSLSSEQIDRIAKYRDWSVKYNQQEQQNAQIQSDKKIAGIGQKLGETKLEVGKPSGSLEAIKSLTNIGGFAGSPTTRVDWEGIANIATNPIETGKQATWDINEHIKPISENFRKAIEGTDETGKPLTGFARTLKAGVGLIDSIFMPITYPLQKIGNEQDPTNINYAGNTINKLLALPFTVVSGAIALGGEKAGLSQEESADIGIIIAGLLPFMKKGKQKPGTELSTETIKDKFSKISDLGDSGRAMYRQGAMEIHPDISGLPDTYMARFNEAATRGDITGMAKILDEARIAKQNLGKEKPVENTTVTKEQEIGKPVEESNVNKEVLFEKNGEVGKQPESKPIEKVPDISKPIEKTAIVSAGIAGNEMKANIEQQGDKGSPIGISESQSISSEIDNNAELNKLRVVANDYRTQYEKIDRKIMEIKSQGREVPEDMTAEKIDLQEKLRSSNWKVQDMIDDLEELNKKRKEEEKTVQEKTYRESLKEVGMSQSEIEKTLTIEKEFGLDIEKSEFIDAFVSKEIGRKFTYNTDLAGKYDTQIETAVQIAKDTYKKVQKSKKQGKKNIAADSGKSPQIAEETISKTETPESVSPPEKQETSNIESIKKLSNKEIQEKYTPSEILAIEDKENPTPEEKAIHDRYVEAVQAEETEKINKEIETDYSEYGQHVAISEDSEITYRDLEILAQRIAQTLNDPKIRFGLKRSKKDMDISPKTENYLRTSKESTIETLTQDFYSLKSGLMEIVKYYQMSRKHPYTRQKLRELYESLEKGEYDFLEQNGDLFTSVINPYLYEGKKPVSTKVGKTKPEGARGGGKVSDSDSRTASEEGNKKVGTSKTGIVNALEKVEEEFKKTENKYPTFAEIDKKTAMEASRGTSFDPEKRGEQRIQGFKVEMEELYDEMIQYAKTDEQIEIVRNEVSDLSQKLAVKQNEINRAESGVVSYMITGPARFPVERMRKKNEAIQRKYEDYTEFKERAKNAIIKKLKGQEVESVGGPIEALKLEIQKLTEYRDLAKRVNAIIKKYKTEEKIYEALIADGVGEKLAKEASTPVRHSGKIETIMLTNLNNKIKEREAKLEKMQKMEAIKGTDEAIKELYTFDGGKVLDNRGEGRVQIIFDEKPTSTVIYDLKKNGWRWSPTNSAWQRFRNSGSVRVAREMFPEVETKKFQSTKLTTKILTKLGDRETVSKEFIMNLTNSGDVKQIEKDIIRTLLETEGDKINVPEFKRKVESELLPLKVVTPELGMGDIDDETGEFLNARYERVTLPPEIRGNILNYREKIYESPIDTEAGNIHFDGDTEKYFGHTRIEDMAGTDPYKPDYTKANGVRRVIEVQSDLFQKGNLEKEMFERNNAGRALKSYIEKYGEKEGKAKLLEDKGPGMNDFDNKMTIEKYDEAKKLSQYNDPTAHFRMIREEVSSAAVDGIKKLQFPTGETAMKIEGLGSINEWGDYELSSRLVDENPNIRISELQRQARLTPENLKVGKQVNDGGSDWIITEVLGDGKFKALPKLIYEDAFEAGGGGMNRIVRGEYRVKDFEETFDISGKVDQNNPIFKFYEKEVGRYLKNNYNGSLITDDKGVSWYQIDITPDMQNQVLAFQEKDNTWIYDIIGAKYKVKPFAQEKIDIKDVYLEAVNLAPEGWKVRIEDPTEENYLENVSAYADLATKEIVISSTEARKSTAAHEVVHASLSELPDNQRKVIIETAKKQWETETKKTISDEQAEEFLAEEFKYFIENKKYRTKTLFGRLKEFISKLWNTIKGAFGKDNKVKTFYEEILSGKEIEPKTKAGKKINDINKILDKTPNKYIDSFMDASRDTLVPIDSVIGDIDESLKTRLIDMEQGIHNSDIMKEGRKVLGKIQEKLKDKKKSEEWIEMDIAMKNRDIKKVEEMAKKLDLVEEIAEIRILLDKIHKVAESVGVEQGYFEEYFPRTVRDANGLMKYFSKSEAGPQIQEAIKKVEIKESRELTNDEKIKIANDLLMGRTIEGVSLSKIGNTLKRKIETVGSEINPFYNDSMDSVAIYIQGMNNMIEQRKLFGKVYSEKEIEGIRKVKALKNSVQAINDELYPLFEEYDGYDREKAMEKRKELRKSIKDAKGDQESFLQEKIDKLSKEIDNYDRMVILRDRKKTKIEEGKDYLQFEQDMINSEKQNDLNASIGAYTLELIKAGKITMEQERILTRALEARFNTKSMSAFLNAYRSVVYLTTMGSFISAISQVQDMAFSMHENGIYLTTTNWGKSLFGFSQIKVSDIGIQPIIFEFAEMGKLQKAVEWTFNTVGITLTNKAGQEALINGYYQKLQRQLKNPKKYGGIFADTWMKKFDFSLEEQQEIIKALENNEVNHHIERILFHKITQYQPITPSQMPRNYLVHPDGRIVYTLKTYQIKQIDVIRQEAFKKISKGKRTRNEKLAMEGWKALVKLALFLFMMGGASDILKDLLLNRPVNISDLVWNNILKIAGFSKYTIWKGKEEGLGAAVFSITNPPLNLFNDPFVDFTYFQSHPFDATKLQTINNIPVVGKPFYWWIGKGADKSEKKRTSGKKEITLPTKKFSSGFGSKSGFSSKSGLSTKSGF